MCFRYPHSTKHLVDLLVQAIQTTKLNPPKIIIIAHSLGCRLVCFGFGKPIQRPRNLKNLKLDHAIFIAPNVDREEFDQSFKPALRSFSQPIDDLRRFRRQRPVARQTPIQCRFDRSASSDSRLTQISDQIQTFLYYEKQLPGQIDLVDVSFSSKQRFS